MPIFVLQRFRHTLTHIPLRWVLVIPFVLQVGGAVGLVGYLSWRTGEQAVNQLAENLQQEINTRIVQYLDSYLATPVLINQINQDAFSLGQLSFQNKQLLERHLFHQLKQFNQVSFITISDANGEFRTANRYPQPSLLMSTAVNPRLVNYYAVNAQGQKTTLLTSFELPEDPQERPWYRAAIQAKRMVHVPIYALGDGSDFSMNVSSPIVDPQTQQIQGVVSAASDLSFFRKFLTQLQVGRTGRVFIVERTGLLVGTSTQERPFTTQLAKAHPVLTRLTATASEDPLIQATSRVVESRFGNWQQISGAQQLTVPTSHDRLLVQINPYRDALGLDWLIVTVIPASDFTTTIQANTTRTFFLCGLTLFATTVLGGLTARWVTQPILRINQASRALAQGKWQSLPIHTPIAELKTLTQSFNQTAEQLHRSLERTKLALYESEDKFAKIFRTSPDVISIVSFTDGTYLEVNDHFLALTGYGREQVIGRSVTELELIAQPEKWTEIHQLLQTDQIVHNYELELQTHSGGIKTGLMSSELIDLEGQPYILSVFKDYTDRKQAEAALRRSEATLRQAQRVAHVGSWEVDLATRTITWSEELYRIHQRDPRDAPPSPEDLATKIIHPDDRLAYQAFTQQLHHGEAAEQDFRIRLPDGSLRQIAAKGETVFDESGQPIRLVGTVLDITDRKQAERALQESEAQMRAILLAIPDIIALVSADGIYLASIRTNTLIDLVPEHINPVGQPLSALLPANVACRHLQAIQKALATHSPEIYEQQLWIGNRMQYEEIRVVACEADTALIIIRDISDRIQAEEALRLSEATNRALLQAIPDLLIRMHRDGTYLNIKPATAFAMQVPPWEMEGANIRDFLSPEVVQQRLTVTATALDTQEIQAYEFSLTFDGQLCWREARIIPLSQEDVLIVIRDLSDRKQAEAALRESEERFRRAFDDAAVGMALVGLEGQLLKVNQSLCEILGYSEMELLEQTFQNLTYPDDLIVELACFHQTLIGERRSYQLEKRLLHKQGYLIWAFVNVSLVKDETGTPLYFVSQIQDISERHSIDRMKDEFISVVSHELRTPLTAIRGSLGLLRSGRYDHQPDKFNHILQMALNNSDRLVRLVNDILNLERLESGKIELVMEACQVDDLLKQAVEAIQPLAQQHSITLTLKSLTAMVSANPDAIVQTLTNLLSNAIKFSPAGSQIELRAVPYESKKDEAIDLPSSSYILFSIQDQGRGIPSDKLETIFGRFQQVDASDSRQKGGTGLGLSICKSIVQQHGGQIWATSELRQGSIFYFTLPLPP